MLWDTHAHYDDKAFDEDRREVLESLAKAGVALVVNVASSVESISACLALAEEYAFVYGAVGVHPCESHGLDEEAYALLERALGHEKCLALGEIGLDYYWDTPEREVQREHFVRQLHMAKTHAKPVVIHSRDAAAQTLDILKAEGGCRHGGVIHCYSYSKEMARDFLDQGFYLGIGGVATFANAKKLAETIAYAPMDRLVLETDCPYLAPVPHRGRRNSSLYLPYVARAVADIKRLPLEEVENRAWSNSHRLYRLPLSG